VEILDQSIIANETIERSDSSAGAGESSALKRIQEESFCAFSVISCDSRATLRANCDFVTAAASVSW
jgi:hypothetical protein